MGDAGILARMNTPIAIICGAVILAASFSVVFRYEIRSTSIPAEAQRLDRWTGRIQLCGYDSGPGEMVCK